MNTCRTCKYWEQDERLAVLPGSMARRCSKAIQQHNAFGFNEDGDYTLLPEYKTQKMFVADASQYYAMLLTRSDFGCTEYEEFNRD